MKKYLLLYLLINASHLLASNGCDSVVISVVKKNNIGHGWEFAGAVTSTYSDSLIQIQSTLFNGTSTTTYAYDSLNRLIETIIDTNLRTTFEYNTASHMIREETFRWNGSAWFQNISCERWDYLPGSNGLDSVIIYYRFTNVAPFIKWGYFYLYDSANRVSDYYGVNYDTILQQWTDTGIYTYSSYSPGGSIQYDTSYYSNSIQPFKVTFTTRDSFNHIIDVNTVYLSNFQTYGTHYYFNSLCQDRIDSIHQYDTGGPNVFTDLTTIYRYDSICRPVSYFTSEQNPAGFFLTSGQYYYGDCDHIVVAGADTIITCLNNQADMQLMAAGGSGPLSFSWTPTDSLSSLNILNPIVYTDSGNTYHIDVTDTAGHAAGFDVRVFINHFTTVATDASCSVCTDGSVQLQFRGIDPGFQLSVLPNSGIWIGHTLSGLAPGNYTIRSSSSACNYSVQVQISSPLGVEESNADASIQIFPNPANELLNVRIESARRTDWTIADIQGRVLMSGANDGNEFQIPLDQLSGGMYMLHLDRHLTKMLIRN